MAHFIVKANMIERRFCRKMKTGAVFFTGKGFENQLHQVTDKLLYIKTSKGNIPLPLSRKKIRDAIAFVLERKTATRKNLEKFSPYNSALMGLLQAILYEIARITRTVGGLLRITIRGVRFFFSGMDRPSKKDWNAFRKQPNARYILNSFYYIRQRADVEEWIKKVHDAGLKLLVDSGAYTLFRQKEKGGVVRDIEVAEYAGFIKKYHAHICGFFNLDVIGDPVRSAENYKLLTQLTGQKPIPVWGCHTKNWKESDWKGLERMVTEDHDIIAIGGTVILGKNAGPKKQNEVKRRLFEEIFARFPEQNFHWLGGSSNLLIEFPFFSADSSGWIQGRRKQQIYTFDPEGKATQKMDTWTAEQCMAHNINILSSLEEEYNGLQISMDLLAI